MKSRNKQARLIFGILTVCFLSFQNSQALADKNAEDKRITSSLGTTMQVPVNYKACENRLTVVAIKIKNSLYKFCHGVMLDEKNNVVLVNKHTACYIKSDSTELTILKMSKKYDLALVQAHPKIVRDLSPHEENENTEIGYNIYPWPGNTVWAVSFQKKKCNWSKGEIDLINRKYIAVEGMKRRKGDSGQALYDSAGKLVGVQCIITKSSRKNPKAPKLSLFIPAQHILDFLNNEQ